MAPERTEADSAARGGISFAGLLALLAMVLGGATAGRAIVVAGTSNEDRLRQAAERLEHSMTAGRGIDEAAFVEVENRLHAVTAPERQDRALGPAGVLADDPDVAEWVAAQLGSLPDPGSVRYWKFERVDGEALSRAVIVMWIDGTSAHYGAVFTPRDEGAPGRVRAFTGVSASGDLDDFRTAEGASTGGVVGFGIWLLYWLIRWARARRLRRAHANERAAGPRRRRG